MQTRGQKRAQKAKNVLGLPAVRHAIAKKNICAYTQTCKDFAKFKKPKNFKLTPTNNNRYYDQGYYLLGILKLLQNYNKTNKSNKTKLAEIERKLKRKLFYELKIVGPIPNEKEFIPNVYRQYKNFNRRLKNANKKMTKNMFDYFLYEIITPKYLVENKKYTWYNNHNYMLVPPGRVRPQSYNFNAAKRNMK